MPVHPSWAPGLPESAGSGIQKEISDFTVFVYFQNHSICIVQTYYHQLHKHQVLPSDNLCQCLWHREDMQTPHRMAPDGRFKQRTSLLLSKNHCTANHCTANHWRCSRIIIINVGPGSTLQVADHSIVMSQLCNVETPSHQTLTPKP